MIDKERVGRILADIDRYLADLESLHVKTADNLQDKKTFYSASMLAFSLINRSIDLGEEIITAKNLGTPSTYKDIFFLLWRGKIINRSMRDKLSELSYYRNLFSHEYYSFTEDDVFKAIRGTDVIRDFTRKVRNLA